MAHALPLTKLASLLVKTLAKPLSKRIKHDFSRFDATKQLLIGIGQTNHRITSRMTIWSSGYRVKNIKPLDSEKALKDGAEFVGEGFIFVVSFGLLLWEYNRTQEANKAKQETKRQQIKAEQAVLKAKLHALDIRLKAVEDVIKEQTDSLLGLSKGKYKQPPPQELVPIDDDDDDDSNGSEMEANKENGKKSEGSDSAEERDTAPTESRLWWRFW